VEFSRLKPIGLSRERPILMVSGMLKTVLCVLCASGARFLENALSDYTRSNNRAGI